MLGLSVVFIVTIWPAAVCAAEGWDDFSNNLATDLAPILSLFGEQVTKQYLSECVSLIDCFIFAMAPMGILTAIVSLIRVCGSSSMRAFIGRAGEVGGNAEAELCSSTSRHVCELYHNGVITRVFGRPRILEVVYSPPLSTNDYEHGESAGIYTFDEYMGTPRGRREWPARIGQTSPQQSISPNLSLNVGIKGKNPIVFFAVALVGFGLQTGVLVFALMVTYAFKWKKGDKNPPSYACPMVVLGTTIVCFGNFLCAFLIEKSTGEQIFRKKRGEEGSRNKSTIHWLQPGGQVLGDQILDAFSYNDSADPLYEYTISWKEKRNKEFLVWVVVIGTILGFVMQFVGLRGVHSSVSVVQLGVMLFMGALRASLRMKRFNKDENILGKIPDKVVGHELDWLALRIGWDSHGASEDAEKISETRLNPYCQYSWDISMIPGDNKMLTDSHPDPDNHPNNATKILAYRRRLANITETPTFQPQSEISAMNFDIEHVAVRRTAAQLAVAIEATANIIFSKEQKIRDEWQTASEMFWGLDCLLGKPSFSWSRYGEKGADEQKLRVYLSLKLDFLYHGRPKKSWKFPDRDELEAMLGLWMWSMKSNQFFNDRIYPKSIDETGVRRIVAIGEETAMNNIHMWLNSRIIQGNVFCRDIVDQYGDATTIWQTDSDLESLAPVQSQSWRPVTLHSTDPRQKFRLLGWASADPSKLPHGPGTQSRLSYTEPEGSLISITAQEIFSSFVRAACEAVEDGWDVDLLQETGGLHLSNSLVNKMADAFVETQLGSHTDALECIIPPLLPRMKMPCPEDVLAAAVEVAAGLRKRREWRIADSAMVWALEICYDAYINDQPSQASIGLARRASVAICELYRWVFVSTDNNHVDNTNISWALARIRFFLDEPKYSIEPFYSVFTRYYSIAFPIATVRLRQAYLPQAKGINSLNVDIANTLLGVAKAGDLTTTLYFLSDLPDDISKKELSEVLFIASKHGWTEVVQFTAELGAQLNYREADLRTAMSYAAEAGDLQTIKVLLDHGTSPNSFDRSRRGPLSYAAEFGHEHVVKLLLGVPLIVADVKDKNGWTPLHWAAKSGHARVVHQLLLRQDVDVNAVDSDKLTPLAQATIGGHLQVIERLLVEPIVDINLKGKDGNTALSLAAQLQLLEPLRRLLADPGIHVNIQNIHGRTPLSLAAQGKDNVVFKELLSHPEIDALRRDNDGRTPLWWAIKSGNQFALEHLLARIELYSETQLGERERLSAFAVESGLDNITVLFLEHLGVNREVLESEVILNSATESSILTLLGTTLGQEGQEEREFDPDDITRMQQSAVDWARDYVQRASQRNSRTQVAIVS